MKNDDLQEKLAIRLQWAMAEEPWKYGCQLKILFPLCCIDLKLDKYYDTNN